MQIGFLVSGPGGGESDLTVISKPSGSTSGLTLAGATVRIGKVFHGAALFPAVATSSLGRKVARGSGT